MMRGTVLSDKTGPVEAECHGKPLDGHIMYDMAVGSLQKRAVYRHKGLQTVLGHASGKCHGMSLGNAYIKRACRILLLKHAHGCARRHGGGDAHHTVVGIGNLYEGASEDVLIFGRFFG